MTAADDMAARLVLREGPPKDVGDGKGLTRWGQTPAWLEQFSLPIPDNAEQAAANYVRWFSITGIGAVFAPTGVDDLADIVIDIGVMSDHRKGIKALQTVLGVTVDGVMGPETISALAACNRSKTARGVIAWDMRYQGRLITRDPIERGQWAAGWADRMASHVEHLA